MNSAAMRTTSRPPPKLVVTEDLLNSIKVIPAWLYEYRRQAVQAAVSAAKAYRQTPLRVAVAELVNDRVKLSSDEVRLLHEQNVEVVQVSSRLKYEAGDSDPLKVAALTILAVDDHVNYSRTETKAPTVDEGAAKAVDEAYNNLNEATDAERQEVVDALYAQDGADDGTR